MFKDRVYPHLTRPSPSIPNRVVQAVKAGRIDFALIQAGTDTINSDYTPQPPWAELPFIFEITLPTKYSLCPRYILDEIANTINTNTEPNSLQLFTDGSVDADSGHSGSAVFSNQYTATWRLPNNCLFAINEAISSALTRDETLMHIYTDYLQTFKKQIFENVNLTSTILAKIQTLHLRNHVLFHLGPEPHRHHWKWSRQSCICSRTLPQDNVQNSTKPRPIKSNHRNTTARNQHILWVYKNLLSAKWYKEVLQHSPPPISWTTPRTGYHNPQTETRIPLLLRNSRKNPQRM